MLRLVVVLLLVANLGYYAWAHGALAMFGTVPASLTETEPQRLARQVRPEMLQIRRVEAAR
ncbi:MAG: sporulation protein [Variovorax sp.]|nr:MAG: sporulation protein [Variovorax sp.]